VRGVHKHPQRSRASSPRGATTRGPWKAAARETERWAGCRRSGQRNARALRCPNRRTAPPSGTRRRSARKPAGGRCFRWRTSRPGRGHRVQPVTGTEVQTRPHRKGLAARSTARDLRPRAADALTRQGDRPTSHRLCTAVMSTGANRAGLLHDLVTSQLALSTARWPRPKACAHWCSKKFASVDRSGPCRFPRCIGERVRVLRMLTAVT